jgi:Flp pilus assembly protein TadD
MRARILTQLERVDEARRDLTAAIELDLRNQDARKAMDDLNRVVE